MLRAIVAFCLVSSVMLQVVRGDGCDQPCDRKAAPVCVVRPDGSRRSYASSCVAECFYGEDKANIVNKACSDIPCVCTFEHSPVCGNDGQPYANACTAKCSGVPIVHNGPCGRANRLGRRDDLCGCPAIYAPVCASNGYVYSSACNVKCAGFQVDNENRCGLVASQIPAPVRRSPCICHLNIDEVCDENGVPYVNKCVAECGNVKVTECSKK